MTGSAPNRSNLPCPGSVVLPAWVCYQCGMAKSAQRLVVAGGVLTLVIGLTSGVATSALPSSWRPHLWLAWPITIVLGLIYVVVQVRQQDTGSLPAAQPGGPNARSLLLESVHSVWVAGILEHSLYQEARIEVGLTSSVDAPQPWRLTSAEPAGQPAPVPPGTPLDTVFRDLHQRMLILGSPGSGKTTTMLELLRQLLEKAQLDESAPIPVFLPLASWSKRQPPLEQWVLQEVSERYDVAPGHVRAWLESSQLLLLLDGLDEVEAEARQKCVEAINDFRHERKSTPITICCRTQDYQLLKSVLNVYGVLTVQTLNREQVERLLDRPDGLYAGVRDALARQPWLWDLADRPLFLSFMMLGFRGQGNDNIAGDPAENEDQGRSLLIAKYVRTMLSHRRDPDPPQTVRQLAFIARQMQRINQTVFTPDLLGFRSEPDTWWYTFLSGASRVILEATGMAVMGAIAAAFYGWRGAIAGVLAGLCSAFEDYTDSIDLSTGPPARFSSDRFQWRRVWKESSAYFESMDETIRPTFILSMVIGLIFGLPHGLSRTAIAQFITFLRKHAIHYVTHLSKDETAATRHDLLHIFIYALAVMCAGLIATWLERSSGPVMEDVRPLNFARDFPSPRLSVVLRASADVILAGVLISGAVAGLLVTSITTAANGLHFGIAVSGCAAIYLFKSLSGFAFVEQARIRFVLRWTNLLPMPSRPTMVHAVQCLFLQETGDGYMFRHVYIQEFFSDLCPPEQGGGVRNQPDPARINNVLLTP